MIEFLGKWIEGIAISVIIASIFEMIIPNGNIKKYIKIVLGIYVIFSIISPFVDSKKLYSVDVSKSLDKYFENKDVSNKQTKPDLNKIYIETLEEEIKKSVEKQGYKVYKCTVKGNFEGEDENVGISKVDIILESKEKSTVDENTTSIDDVDKIEKVEINIGENSIAENNSEEITLKDMAELKKYLSEHYELDKEIISIRRTKDV